MTKNFKAQVDLLFKDAPDRREEIRENPVTGGRFVAGLDPVRPQKLIAQRALAAREWFDAHKPDDLPELPLKQVDREHMKGGGQLCILSVFARSLANRDYRTEGHPHFDEYARGVMASSLTPPFIQEDAHLLERYPPEPLNGMGPGLMWQGR